MYTLTYTHTHTDTDPPQSIPLFFDNFWTLADFQDYGANRAKLCFELLRHSPSQCIGLRHFLETRRLPGFSCQELSEQELFEWELSEQELFEWELSEQELELKFEIKFSFRDRMWQQTYLLQRGTTLLRGKLYASHTKCIISTHFLRLTPVLKTIFHQCVTSYICSQSCSGGSVFKTGPSE